MTPPDDVVTERDARVELPDRYLSSWRAPFEDRAHRELRPNINVLDIGSGRNPSIPDSDRPPGTTYVGLDISADELDAARAGTYDDKVAADVARFAPELVDRFDLVISWQVLEHVKPLDVALDNIYRYTRPGGLFVSVFSGTFSAFGLLNRVIPESVSSELVGRAMRRKGSTQPVFPAYYHKCYASALHGILAPWDDVEVVPLYRGATYFHFSKLLSRVYLWYENAASSRRLENLATHYLISARRPAGPT